MTDGDHDEVYREARHDYDPEPGGDRPSRAEAERDMDRAPAPQLARCPYCGWKITEPCDGSCLTA